MVCFDFQVNRVSVAIGDRLAVPLLLEPTLICNPNPRIDLDAFLVNRIYNVKL